MSITSYPRVTVQGTNALNNTQNGNALMILNPSTGLYEAATASTFGGGGGGGSATAANQTTQIGLETTLNSIVSTAANQTTEISILNSLPTSGLATSALQNSFAAQNTIDLNAILAQITLLKNESLNIKKVSNYVQIYNYASPATSEAQRLRDLFPTAYPASDDSMYFLSFANSSSPSYALCGQYEDGTIGHGIRNVFFDGMYFTADMVNSNNVLYYFPGSSLSLTKILKTKL
jgi:hypothetical protein